MKYFGEFMQEVEIFLAKINQDYNSHVRKHIVSMVSPVYYEGKKKLPSQAMWEIYEYLKAHFPDLEDELLSLEARCQKAKSLEVI